MTAQPWRQLRRGCIPSADAMGILLPFDYRNQIGNVSSSMNGHSRLHWVSVLGVKVGCAALLLWIIYANIDFASVRQRVDRVSAFTCLLLTFVFALHAVLSAVRWQTIVVHLGGSASFRAVVSGSLVERFVNQALPAIVGGDGARIVELVRSGEKVVIAAHSVFIDRLFSLAGAFGLVLVLLPLSSLTTTPIRFRLILMLVSAASLLAVAALLIPRPSFWARLDGNRLARFVSRVATVFQEFLLTPRLAVLKIGVSLIMQALFVGCFLILSYDLKIDLPITEAAALVPLVMLASLIPVSLAGWGVREAAAAALLPTAGVPISDAVTLSLLFGIAYLVTSCLAGVIWLIMHAVGRRDADAGPDEAGGSARSDSQST